MIKSWLLGLILTISTAAFGEELKTQIVVSGDSPVRITTEILEPSSAKDISNQIEDFKSRHANDTIVVSSDVPEILVKQAENDRVFTVPVGEVSKEWKTSRVVDVVKNYGRRVGHDISQDKIGFMIVTFNTMYDSYIWMHAANLSEFERTGNVLFTVMTSIVFGLNKDTWARTTRPFYKFFKNVAGLEHAQLAHDNPKDITLRFFASLTLATTINLARLPFLSFNSLVDSTISLNAWTYPIFLGIVSTVASFAWSEHIAMIDQKVFPASKFVFRRVMEFRSVILGTFAATAKLLNPELYGVVPWFTLVSSGTLGLYLYADSNRWVKMIENSELINKWLRPWLETQNSCRAVFL